MIDIWAIVTMMIPFLEVVIHTMLDVLRKQKEEATEEKGNILDIDCAIEIEAAR